MENANLSSNYLLLRIEKLGLETLSDTGKFPFLMTPLGSEFLPTVSRLAHISMNSAGCKDPDEQKADASMWTLIEQALYLPIYLHLEKKYLICCLAMALFRSFRFQQRKETGGGRGAVGCRLLNKLPYLIFMLLPTECYISNPSSSEEDAEAWQRQYTIPSFIC